MADLMASSASMLQCSLTGGRHWEIGLVVQTKQRSPVTTYKLLSNLCILDLSGLLEGHTADKLS